MRIALAPAVHASIMTLTQAVDLIMGRRGPAGHRTVPNGCCAPAGSF
ncbi:MAG: hypothetical protein ACI9YM_000588 [Brevundimonas sp.]|jgi:hypothetical protein|nr:hypothetical protein [Brevundimonas sp.]MDI1281154.1 hypothetical protein [Brevundimonas sp.]